MRAARLGLMVVGLAAAAYGVVLLLDRPWEDVVAVGTWLVAGVVLHDLVLAPVVVGVWWALARLLASAAPTARRGRLEGPLAAGLLVWGSVTLAAVPVLGRFGARPDNPTLLDRDYLTGWLVFTLVVAAGVIIGVLGTRADDPALPRRTPRRTPGRPAGGPSGRPTRTSGGGDGQGAGRR